MNHRRLLLAVAAIVLGACGGDDVMFPVVPREAGGADAAEDAAAREAATRRDDAAPRDDAAARDDAVPTDATSIDAGPGFQDRGDAPQTDETVGRTEPVIDAAIGDGSPDREPLDAPAPRRDASDDRSPLDSGETHDAISGEFPDVIDDQPPFDSGQEPRETSSLTPDDGGVPAPDGGDQDTATSVLDAGDPDAAAPVADAGDPDAAAPVADAGDPDATAPADGSPDSDFDATADIGHELGDAEQPTCRVLVNAASTSVSPDAVAWTSAFSDLQQGLARARQLSSTGKCEAVEVWVAAGTYRPARLGDRDSSFMLVNHVALYGGFAGTETELQARDWKAHETILSGDLRGNHADKPNNSRHVVQAGGVDRTSVIDGFVITEGQGDCVDGREDEGGGLFAPKGSPRIAHVAFHWNYACRGGGMSSDLDPSLFDTSFVDNGAGTETNGGEGGGLYLPRGGTPSLEQLYFENNRAVGRGGGAHVVFRGGTFRDLTFRSNLALALGARIFPTRGWGLGGGLYLAPYTDTQTLPAGVEISRTQFIGNAAADAGAGLYAQGVIQIVEGVFQKNQLTMTDSAGAGAYLWAGAESKLERVRFEDNSTDGLGGGLAVMEGRVEVLDGVFFRNRAADGGAFYGINLSAANALFADNHADRGGAVFLRRPVSSSEDHRRTSFTNATFAQNGASAGSAVFSRVLDTPEIVNSLLWDAGVGASELETEGLFTGFVMSYSCMLGGVPTSYDRGHNLAVCGPDASARPFVDTADFHLVPGAAAIDAGNDVAPGLAGVTADLDGRPRFAGTVDLGAYER